jgi:hypothetical protein
VFSGVVPPERRRLQRQVVAVEGGATQSRSLLHKPLMRLLGAAGSEAVKLR